MSSGASRVIATAGSTGTKLTVQGDVAVSGSISGARVLGAIYQDIAEWVPATADMPAGTVVRLNRDAANVVEPSSRAYDTAVAGVVSAQPGILLGMPGEGKAQIATTGRVKVRVTAANGAIGIGDLLVASDRSGVAMKSEALRIGAAELHRPGTILGKALEALPSGDGEILVAVRRR